MITENSAVPCTQWYAPVHREAELRSGLSLDLSRGQTCFFGARLMFHEFQKSHQVYYWVRLYVFDPDH